MNTPIVKGPPMRDEWNRRCENDGKITEKFISSLEMVVWCEWPCRNSTSHEGLVWGIDVFIAERFPANLGSF